MTDRLDALVIGGGPGGATAALLLARAGWSVALLERKSFPRRKVCGEYLSATNLPLLGQLGVGAAFRTQAGPPVDRVSLFAGHSILTAALPRPVGGEWGRALSREHLDTLLLAEAAKAGTQVYQPWSALELAEDEAGYRCVLQSATRECRELRARVIVAAHGSWEFGTLPTQPPRQPPQPADLFAFKAHFVRSDLPVGLMPLLCFPGGYGGMVHCDGGRVSLSCCIRRDRLALQRHGSADAAPAVLEHIRASCLGFRLALANAELADGWLATGPIRPGIRVRPKRGVFLVGNCCWQKLHPVVAEGISMAMQAAWLLAEHLTRAGPAEASSPQVGIDYAAAWPPPFPAPPRLRAVVSGSPIGPCTRSPSPARCRCWACSRGCSPGALGSAAKRRGSFRIDPRRFPPLSGGSGKIRQITQEQHELYHPGPWHRSPRRRVRSNASPARRRDAVQPNAGAGDLVARHVRQHGHPPTAHGPGRPTAR